MSNDRHWQNRLEEIEAELNQTNSQANSAHQETTTEPTFPRVEINPSPQVKHWLNSAKNWFETLPQIGKIAVGIGAVWVSFSILNALFHIVSSLVSIALMGFLLYVGYKFVVNSGDNS